MITNQDKDTDLTPTYPKIFSMTDEELAETTDLSFESDEADKQQTVSNAINAEFDYASLSELLRVRLEENILPPPVCLSVEQDGQTSIFGTLGNFSVLIGKAKSRKTFAISIIAAAALKQDLLLNRFSGTFGQDKQVILIFDTEQSRFHVSKVAKRICQLAGQKATSNLLVFTLRSLSTIQRLEFIDWQIYNTPNVGLVIIDGIRDVVQDINNYAEATDRINDLLRWSEQRNIHILTVIHMNKGNDQIRGSLGTELQNKAETVVSVGFDLNDKDISIMTAELCRDKAFSPLAFSLDDQDLPYIIEGWEPDQRSLSRKATKANESRKSPQSITPSQLSIDTHLSILEKAFGNVEADKYTPTCYRIKTSAENLGYKFGDNKAKEFITYYVDKGWLRKVDAKYTVFLPSK